MKRKTIHFLIMLVLCIAMIATTALAANAPEVYDPGAPDPSITYKDYTNIMVGNVVPTNVRWGDQSGNGTSGVSVVAGEYIRTIFTLTETATKNGGVFHFMPNNFLGITPAELAAKGFTTSDAVDYYDAMYEKGLLDKDKLGDTGWSYEVTDGGKTCIITYKYSGADELAWKANKTAPYSAGLCSAPFVIEELSDKYSAAYTYVTFVQQTATAEQYANGVWKDSTSKMDGMRIETDMYGVTLDKQMAVVDKASFEAGLAADEDASFNGTTWNGKALNYFESDGKTVTWVQPGDYVIGKVAITRPTGLYVSQALDLTDYLPMFNSTTPMGSAQYKELKVNVSGCASATRPAKFAPQDWYQILEKAPTPLLSDKSLTHFVYQIKGMAPGSAASSPTSAQTGGNFTLYYYFQVPADVDDNTTTDTVEHERFFNSNTNLINVGDRLKLNLNLSTVYPAKLNGEIILKYNANWTDGAFLISDRVMETNEYIFGIRDQYRIGYKFESVGGQALPQAVMDLLPVDNSTHAPGTVSPSNTPRVGTTVSVIGGVWVFTNWDASSKTITDDDVSFTGTWKFTNTSPLPGDPTYSVTLTKVDSANKSILLSGAVFTLYNDVGNTPVGIFTTDATGKVTVSNLVNGSYHFTETSAPSGYKTDSTKHSFTINGKDAALTVMNTKISATPSDLNSVDHIKYVVGYPDGEVKPNGSITRAEVTTMFYRLLTASRRDAIFTSTNNFSDVKNSLWYNKAVSSMTKGGYVTGYEDGSFGGNKAITRAEFVAIAARFMDAKSAAVGFTDVSSGHWAYQYIATAVSYGWIDGYTDGTFKPDQPITRAEAMAIINRMLNRGVDADGVLSGIVKWPDNLKSAWYYYDVVEATNEHTYTGSRPSEKWTSLDAGYTYDIAKYEHP